MTRLGIWQLGACLVTAVLVGMAVQRYVAVAVPSSWRAAVSNDGAAPGAGAERISEGLQGELAVFVLAGQSNMSGRAELPPVQQTHPAVLTFGNDYRWRPAREPVDDPTGQVDLVSMDAEPDAAGFGPSLSFGRALAHEWEGRPIGLVPCAKGDTTIGEWQRSASDATLYGSCLKRTRAASVAGRIAGLLFFQGEADAADPARNPQRLLTTTQYAERFAAVIDDLRADIGLPLLPVVFAQIGTNAAPVYFRHWEVIREQQRTIRLPCTGMIETSDLPIGDAVHFTTDSYREIGRRFAAAYVELLADSTCHP